MVATNQPKRSFERRLRLVLKLCDPGLKRTLGEVIDGTLALIDRLMAAGVTVAVLTNNGPLIERHRHRLAPALAERVGERFLVSYVFGMAKPAPDIYRLALDRLGFRPEETVFIDDLAENVAGAEAAGLRGHVFRTPAGLADYFAALGLA